MEHDELKSKFESPNMSLFCAWINLSLAEFLFQR